MILEEKSSVNSYHSFASDVFLLSTNRVETLIAIPRACVKVLETSTGCRVVLDFLN